MLNLSFVLEATKARCLNKKADTFSGISTHSKGKLAGKIFLALKGSRFDGHDFLDEAISQGASAVIVEDASKIKQASVTILQVSNCLEALQNLASHWRELRKLKLVCITGSNGKTTTTNFTKTLLSSLDAQASPKSYNNHIGVPLSLLSVKKEAGLLVQEIGTSHPGEIAHLTRMCKPFASAVTHVGLAHLEGLKNQEDIAQEKQAIYEQNPSSLIFNLDNPYTLKMYEKFSKTRPKNQIFTFSSLQASSVSLQIVEQDARGMKITGVIAGVKKHGVVLKFSGQHNLNNLMCACALALSCGASSEEIWKNIPACQMSQGRETWFSLGDMEIFFDAYNANPSSMRVFLDQLKLVDTAKSLHLILGDMRELGSQSSEYHKQLAQHPCLQRCKSLWYVGEYASLFEEELSKLGWKGKFLSSLTYQKEQLLVFKKNLEKPSVLGIKASRSLGLEQAFFDLTGKTIL